MKKFSLYILGIVALAGPLMVLSGFSKPETALATTVTYVVDTKTDVTVSGLVNGGRYLFCQYADNTSKYEIVNGTSNSDIQIPFATPDYGSLTELKAGVNTIANRFLTLSSAGGSNWYIKRTYGGKYLCSNANSDLVFTTSTTYSSDTRTYFVPIVGSQPNLIRFYISNDTSLYLGTKIDKALFDTWHDQTNSVATKDFLLYRVYTTDEEADNYATSFNTNLGGTCAADGSTSISSLRSTWATMSTNWNDLSITTKTTLKGTAANSSTTANVKSQYKAKYLYIANKYRSDTQINDFMGVRTASLSDARLNSENTKAIMGILAVACLSIICTIGLVAFSRKRSRR